MRKEEIVSDSLIVEGVKYKTNLTEKFKKRKLCKAPNQNLLYSFKTRTVLDVLVKVGQTVEKGEILLIFEAMKMQNNIQMPFKGEIVRITAKPGDSISKKHPLMEVKPA